MARLMIRIEFENGRALGPGKIRLLELIASEGSIRGAAIAMGMSYRRAWLLLHEVETMMGGSVITPETGGAQGGGTTLTKVGRDVIRRYRALEALASRRLGPELRALSRMATRPLRAKTATRRTKRS
jgi:molybdate transport system regulatory protein